MRQAFQMGTRHKAGPMATSSVASPPAGEQSGWDPRLPTALPRILAGANEEE